MRGTSPCTPPRVELLLDAIMWNTFPRTCDILPVDSTVHSKDVQALGDVCVQSLPDSDKKQDKSTYTVPWVKTAGSSALSTERSRRGSSTSSGGRDEATYLRTACSKQAASVRRNLASKPRRSKPRTCQHVSEGDPAGMKCPKLSQGRTDFCARHGGGRRCQRKACGKLAQGSTAFCAAHGGGRRCQWAVDGVVVCDKSAAGSTKFCKGHGGGKRCQWHEGCTKSAQGATNFCMAHGGGRRCAKDACNKIVISGAEFCRQHSDHADAGSALSRSSPSLSTKRGSTATVPHPAARPCLTSPSSTDVEPSPKRQRTITSVPPPPAPCTSPSQEDTAAEASSSVPASSSVVCTTSTLKSDFKPEVKAKKPTERKTKALASFYDSHLFGSSVDANVKYKPAVTSSVSSQLLVEHAPSPCLEQPFSVSFKYPFQIVVEETAMDAKQEWPSSILLDPTLLEVHPVYVGVTGDEDVKLVIDPVTDNLEYPVQDIESWVPPAPSLSPHFVRQCLQQALDQNAARCASLQQELAFRTSV